MALDDVTGAHYQAQQQLARAAADQAQELWGQVRAASAIDQWMNLLGAVVQLLTSGQLAAAQLTNPYLEQLAAAQGVAPPSALVNPSALAGIASDGRLLASLLMQPALQVAGLLARGADDQTALRSGLASLVRIVGTQVADTSRIADQVGITAHRPWVMYVRQVTLPACGRCIILAGRTYSWSTGFQRHPLCDCTIVPVREGDEPPASPKTLFAQMSPEEQDRAFTRGGAEAVRLGADPGQVVNARRGMQTAGGRKITTEGTTVRGVAGKKLGDFKRLPGERYRRSQKIRPMPEQILADAGGDRDEAIRLLEKYSYILPGQAPKPAPERERVEIPHPRQPEAKPTAPVPAAAKPYHRSLAGIEKLAQDVENGQPPKETRRLGGASAETELVTLANGTRVIRKRARVGTEDMQDAAAEQLAATVARALGLRAPGVYRNSGDAIWMEYVTDAVTADEAPDDPRVPAAPSSDEGAVMGLLDLLVNNVDRNSGNWMIDEVGHLVPIDHGMAYGDFITEDMAPTLEWVHSAFAGRFKDRDSDERVDNPLTKDDVAEVRRRLEALRPDFEKLARGHWLDYSLRMLDLLGERASGDRPLIAGVR